MGEVQELFLQAGKMVPAAVLTQVGSRLTCDAPPRHVFHVAARIAHPASVHGLAAACKWHAQCSRGGSRRVFSVCLAVARCCVPAQATGALGSGSLARGGGLTGTAAEAFYDDDLDVGGAAPVMAAR